MEWRRRGSNSAEGRSVLLRPSPYSDSSSGFLIGYSDEEKIATVVGDRFSPDPRSNEASLPQEALEALEGGRVDIAYEILCELLERTRR
jgi:hypothetical protein